MALTDEEIGQVIRQLLASLRQNKLEWVAEQVEETIIQGNVTSKSLRELGISREASLLDKTKTTGPQQRQLVVGEEYTPRQQLFLVLDAIERSIIQLHDVGTHTLSGLRKYSGDLREIEFRSEINEGQNLLLTEQILNDKEPAVRKLGRLLEQLRKEI